MKGWVYIVTNESMPQLVKIGYTTNHPKDRAKELSTTGVPTPFIAQYAVLVENPRNLEQIIHKRLFDLKLHKGKEWFECTVEEAIAILKVECEEIQEEFSLTEQRKRAIEKFQQEYLVWWEEKKRKLEEEQLQEIRQKRIRDVYDAINDRKSDEEERIRRNNARIFSYDFKQLSMKNTYFVICLIVGFVLFLISDERLTIPDFLALTMVSLIIGLVLWLPVWSNLEKKYRARQEASKEYIQIVKRRKDLLLPLENLFPHSSFYFPGVEIEKKILNRIPNGELQNITIGKVVQANDNYLGGIVQNMSETWVVTLLMLRDPINKRSTRLLEIPVCVLPNESVPFISWKFTSENVSEKSWQIQNLFGYEVSLAEYLD